MNRFCLFAAGALLALSTAPASAADFIGSKIKVGWRLPTETEPFALTVSPANTFIVGYDVEADAQLHDIRFLIDFGVDDLTLTFLTNATFSVNTFNGLYFDALTGAGFDQIQAVSGLAADRVHNMGSALSVNFSGKSFVAGDRVTIDFTPTVPEPASWGLMIVGLGAVGAMLRRRPLQRRIAFS